MSKGKSLVGLAPKILSNMNCRNKQGVNKKKCVNTIVMQIQRIQLEYVNLLRKYRVYQRFGHFACYGTYLIAKQK